MAGEYRTPEVLSALPPGLADELRNKGMRIVLAHEPMSGVVARPDLSARMAEAYKRVPGMGKYVDGLRSGDMVPVVPTGAESDRVWRPGELFLMS